MPFNNYFNLNRFARLLKQDLLINKTRYLLAIIGLGLVTYVLCYLFLNSIKISMILNESQINGYYGMCFAIYMVAVGVVMGTAFPDLSDKIKTSNYLLNPGSTLEKLLLQFLIRIVFFVPIALGIFWIAIRLAKASLIPGIVMVNSVEQLIDPAVIPYFDYVILITNYKGKIWETWQIVFMVFGLFSYGIYLFAGATYFKRYALVKTVIASVVILLLSMSFSVLLSHIFYSQETQGFSIKLKDYPVTEHLDSTMIFLLALSLLSWIFFLAMAYFKLKEKEA
jgi:hypothetical protein